MDNRDHQTRDARESVWSILYQWRAAYFTLFAIQNTAGISLLCWYEITETTQDSAAETALAIFMGIGLIGAGSATTVITIMETARSIMVIAASLEDWLKKREQARMEKRVKEVTAEVTAEVAVKVRVETLAEVHKAWSEWNRRRLEAEANGEPFDEPPPDFGQTGPTADGRSSPPPAGA